MAFRFGLEVVLKHRKRLEEAAQRDLAEAQHAVDECLRKLEQMYQRLDEVRDEILTAQGIGTPAKIHEVRDMEAFVGGQKVRIEKVRLEARELLVIAEAKQEALIKAAQEKKILEKLKEKRLLQHREHLRILEAKELDDIVTTRQAWGKK